MRPWMFVLALSLSAAPLFGQEEEEREEELEATRLSPVVVTASKREVESFEEPSLVFDVPREELRRRMVRTVPEALLDVPGVMVQKTSNGQSSPFLRGFTGFRTVFLIDGIRLNNSVFREGPNQYWATIDPGSIDRLEVVMGPTSALYGSDAIGGVVQAFTKRREDYSLDLDWDVTTYGRFAEAERSAGGRVEFEGNIGEEYGFLGGTSFSYYGDVRQGNGVVQDETGYWQQAGDGKATIRFAPGVEFTLAHYEFDQNEVWRTHSTDKAVRFHGTAIGTDRIRRLDQDRRLTYGRLEVERGPFFDRLVATAAVHTQEEEEFRERSDGRVNRQGFEVVTPSLDVQFDSETPIGVLSYGAEWYHDHVNSFRRDFDRFGGFTAKRIQGPVADDSTYDTLGIFLQDEIDLFEDRITLVAGGRYTHTWVDADEIEDPVTGGEFRLHDDWPSVVGSLRVLGRPTEFLHVFAGVNQGFRAPNLSDLTRFDIARSGELEVPSPDLDPEHFLTAEVGAKVEFDRFAFQGAWYYTRIWDLITRRPTGARVGRNLVVTKSNSGDGFVHGVEGEAVWRFHPGWELSGRISWQESLIEQFPSSAPILVEDNMSRMQPLSGGGAIRYTHASGDWYAELSTRFAKRQDRLSPGDERDTQRISPGGTPSYWIFDFRAGYKFNENVRATLAVENFTDMNYRILGSGQQEPGINAVLGFEVRLP